MAVCARQPIRQVANKPNSVDPKQCLQRAAAPTHDLRLRRPKMCGIVGYIGKRDAAPILIEGLHRLEYRGYDSAGIAVAHMGALRLAKCKGRVRELERLLPSRFKGAPGIA